MTDVQVGHEKTLTGLLPALAGANMIYGLGMLESGITFDYGQLLLDCEMAAMIKHVVRGFGVSDDTLARDVIKEIGPEGNFLTHAHTLKYMRSQSQTRFIDRKMWEAWQKSGALPLREKALEKAREILENHRPQPLPRDVRARIRAIVEETEKEMGVVK